MICFTQQKEAVMNVMSLFSPNGPDVVVLSQNKAASYNYQNNFWNHTGIYHPSAAAHCEDTAKMFLFHGMKKSASGKLKAVRNAKKRPLKVIIFLFARSCHSQFFTRAFLFLDAHMLLDYAPKPAKSCYHVLVFRPCEYDNKLFTRLNACYAGLFCVMVDGLRIKGIGRNLNEKN